ncbi:formyl-CoA transferase [Saccharopolyspora erythraea NRRL 2338]|uniref:L-carnitine dehydratase/bile acid-inducible protein F n=2 Tax=Saccharopolyspora erythraea TaxID=1836 RepID=A4FAZ6_SACEN|nr:CoA transferase [Saccharopolyspora erythraea]PFG95005.1 formyl-CoA transferase [Saccharopolyspora erythraea NRRL 2338]QRK91694.1 CoA transferase [Saccharopolyspora erythraea]CAM01221.1 L-carnitine dehydratase/bile acid-inducible protein F [Saccharopolyspora erythraea NRRL 2338]
MERALPMDGVVVADFSRVLAGPYATMLMADLGATVIKVERPGTGDDTRSWGPPWTEHASSYFESVNRGKRSITLDLADPSDQETARELVRRSDVLVENFRPGSLARYGLDFDSAAELNPRLVYASISGFGSGAGADLPGYDFVVQALGGLMSITGSPEGPPTKVGVALVDVLTGKDAALGIMAALRQREATGRGQHVEVNLLSSLLASLVNQMSGMLATGAPPGRMGNQHPSIAPYETLRCEDAYLAVAIGNDGQFRRLADALGLVGLAEDERFATNAQRVANRPALVELLENVLGARPAADWQERLQRAGIACGQVNDLSRAVHYAESLGLNPLVDPGQGATAQVRMPIDFSDSAGVKPLAPPRLGEHGEQIRAWLADPAAGPPPA